MNFLPARSREFYRPLFGAQVVIERDPVILKVANTWLINARVADIKQVHKDWSAKGARFLTEPKDHGREIQAHLRDSDGRQATGILR